MRKEFYFRSSDGKTNIRTLAWKPNGKIKAILQISHGMAEHIMRYNEFAEYLASHAYYVVGNDHLGHGKSVSSAKDYGHLDKKQGNDFLIQDMHLLREKISNEYPTLPYFILGHSMGSTLLRYYILKYGEGLQGVLFSGIVAHQSSVLLNLGKCLSSLIGIFRGKYYRSKFLNYSVLGKYNKMMKNPQSKIDWVTRDLEKLEKYANDELSGFIFTANGYYNIFDGLLRLNNKKNISLLPKDLPMLIISGSEDPVGGFEQGIKDVYEKYKKDGVRDIALKIYEGARHELINEIDREYIYQDIDEWMTTILLDSKCLKP